LSRARFEEAFVVTRYLLGRRGAELREHFAPTSGTALIEALASSERQNRATALAKPLARLLNAAQRGGVQ
jgi:hypothetical protein